MQRFFPVQGQFAPAIDGFPASPQTGEPPRHEWPSVVLFAAPKQKVSHSRRRLRQTHKWLKPDNSVYRCRVCNAFKKRHVAMHCARAEDICGLGTLVVFIVLVCIDCMLESLQMLASPTFGNGTQQSQSNFCFLFCGACQCHFRCWFDGKQGTTPTCSTCLTMKSQKACSQQATNTRVVCVENTGLRKKKSTMKSQLCRKPGWWSVGHGCF